MHAQWREIVQIVNPTISSTTLIITSCLQINQAGQSHSDTLCYRLLSSYVKMEVLFSTTDPETGSSVPNEEYVSYSTGFKY
jgi:hypothetical protein